MPTNLLPDAPWTLYYASAPGQGCVGDTLALLPAIPDAKDSVNVVWWLARTPNPKADNRKALRPYSESMQHLLKNGYRAKLRPSGHDISDNFSRQRPGHPTEPLVLRLRWHADPYDCDRPNSDWWMQGGDGAADTRHCENPDRAPSNRESSKLGKT